MLTILLLMFGISASDSAARTDSTRLWLSQTAREQLKTLPGDFRNENGACMVGTVDGEVVRVDSLIPIDVDSTKQGRTWWLPKNACRTVLGTVGIVHSHPDTSRCWYMFPRTSVETADGNAARKSPFPIDAISCAGETIVWMNKLGLQQTMVL